MAYFSLIRSIKSGLFFYLLFCCLYSYAELIVSEIEITNGKYFVENKGQIIDQNNVPNRSVLFLLNTPKINIQLRGNGFSYDVYSTYDIDEKKSNIEFHRVDFTFLNYNSDCEIIPSNPTSDYINYFGALAPSSGITNIRQYQKVLYRNIYPAIDLEFTICKEKGYKYDFIIRQGADINDIRIMIEGADDILLVNDTLKLSTSLEDIYEVIPNSYFQHNDCRTIVKTHFKKITNELYGFSVDDEIPINSILVIDPTSMCLWGTYYGGSSSEYGWGSSTDSYGNVIITGQTKSSNNIATAGSFQSVYLGINWRGYLIKFDANGMLLWGTYFQGSINGDDRGMACKVGPSGNIYIAGITTSDTGIATPGAHQTIFGGPPGISDVFLAKFNSSGQRIWATYFGGWGEDLLWGGGGGLSTDGNENVFMTGQTNSISGIATPGAYQTTITGIAGFLTKFDSSGVQLWGTYYSGDVTTQFYGCATDTLGNVYATGMTNSTTNIASPGAFQTTIGGQNDALLVSFNPTGQRNWGTYYGGALNDWGRNCTCGSDGYIYLVGWTTSVSGISSPGSYQSSIGGGQDGFLVKFDNLGQRIWGTYYGGLLTDEVIDCTEGDNGDIFICGQTESYDNISTPNSFQQTIGGNYDAFISKFDSLGLRQWGTYFGGTNDDLGGSINYVSEDTIYIQGNTQSLNNIATPTGHQQVFGGFQDAFLEKFIDCWSIPAAQPIIGQDSVCKNTNALIYSTSSLAHAISYHWNVPTGATINSGAGTTTINVDFSNTAVSGYVSVKGLNKCNHTGDSSFLWVTLHSRPIPQISGNDSCCTGQSCVYYTLSGKSQYQWVVSSGGTKTGGGTAVDTSVTILWNIPGPQWVSVNYTDTNGCTGLNSTIKNIEVSIGVPVNVSIIESSNTICQGTSVTFTATQINGGTNPAFQWKVNSINSGTNSPVFTYSPNNGDVVQCVLTSSNTVCTSNNPATSNEIIMTVYPDLPVTISISTTNNPVCEGSISIFTALTSNKGTSPDFQWVVNGNPLGANDSIFAYTPSDGDQVYCILTSSEQCISNNPATSDTITMIVNPLLPVGVSISASSNPVCEGLSVSFTATPINGGTIPVYQWQVNGISNGTNNQNFTYIPDNGDLVTCTLTSNAECVTNNPATSNAITMSVGESPDVSFAICFDTVTTLNAKPFKLKGGTPLGGTYSGPGVNQINGYFNPAMAGVGLKTVSYSYTNLFNCSNNATRAISVVNPARLTCGDSLTDIRDNKKYPTIQIGSQCWLAVNLNHGQQIGGSSAQRDNCLVEKYCYNDLPVNCTQYGALYQWDELMSYEDAEEIQGLCPPGWHVPSESDWNQLFAVYQGNAFAGSPLLYTGYSGFNVLLAGVEFFNQSNRFVDFASIMWSSTSHGPYKAWSHGLNEYNYSVSYYPSYRSNAFSVRCLRE